jgi:hypothetical protein
MWILSLGWPTILGNFSLWRQTDLSAGHFSAQLLMEEKTKFHRWPFFDEVVRHFFSVSFGFILCNGFLYCI